MAALTITPVDPLVVEGSTKFRIYTIAGAIAQGDTITIREFSQVLNAVLVPLTAAGVGLALSGTGLKTLTVQATVGFTGGRLRVDGF